MNEYEWNYNLDDAYPYTGILDLALYDQDKHTFTVDCARFEDWRKSNYTPYAWRKHRYSNPPELPDYIKKHLGLE